MATRIVRWRPMNRRMRLFNEFDRMVDEMGDMPYRVRNDWNLALDVVEHEDDYTVKASIPGIDPDDLDITLEDNVLTIKAEIKEDEEVDEDQYHLRERRYGMFSRSINFPMLVDSNAVDAAYDQGVLTLTIPKAEEVKPRRIAVKAS